MILHGKDRPTTIEVMVDHAAGWKWVCGGGQQAYPNRLSPAATAIAITGNVKAVREHVTLI
ncbi:hypothetical protein ACFQL7_28020 [Halocatena marina]|uniref:Uncharacterized protein n=1 Tax=Halocatena marina TaxID=2934937 RepID=A0ABD5YW06_9EURY